MTQTISREISKPETEYKLRADDGMEDDGKVIIVDYLPVERLFASALNPRKTFDPDALQELADSIAAHGIQQPIVVRPLRPLPGTGRKEPDGSLAVTRYNITHGDLQIVMGERRWRAAILAGLTHIPCLLRQDIDDKLHTLLALEENTKRRDLTAIEEARGYKACMDQGYTQIEIGEKAGISQSRVANIIRLLDLPADVHQMIEDGRLTAGHGIQLARYKDFPALCSFLAGKTVEEKWTVKSLEAGLTYTAAYDALSKQENGHPLLVDLAAYQKTRFDWKAICPQCPFGAFRGRSDRSDGSGFCLKPAHWAELQAESDARTQEAARAEAARQRELAQQKLEDAGQAIVGSGPSSPGGSSKSLSHAIGEQAAAQKSVEALKKAGNTLPNVWELDCSILTVSRPEGCSSDCPCAGKAVSREGKIVDVCTDTRRLESLKRAKTMDENKARKQRFDELRRGIEAAPDALRGSEAMAIMAWAVLRSAKQDPKRQTKLSHLGSDVFQDVSKLLSEVGYGTPDPDAWAILSRLPLGDLLQLTCEVLLREELHNQQEYKSDRTPKTAFILGANMPTKAENIGTSEGHADDAGTSDSGTSPLHPCTDCKTKDAGAFWVDANGYDVDKHAMLGEWVCDLCQGKRMLAAIKAQTYCSNCGEPLTTGAFESAIAAAAARQNPLRMNTGELLLPDGRAFCEQCGPSTDAEGNPINGEEISCQDCGETGHWQTRLLTDKGMPTGEFHPSMLCSDCRSFYPDARACKQCKFIRTDFEPDDAETCLDCRVRTASGQTARLAQIGTTQEALA